MDISTHRFSAPGKTDASSLRDSGIRWLPFGAWQACLWVGMFLFVFLEVERHLAQEKVQRVVAARHAVRVAFRSLDAVSNLEHLLFGFCCAFTGFLAAQTLHHLDPAVATDDKTGRKARRVRARLARGVPILGRAARIFGDAVRRFTPSPARFYAVWQERAALRYVVRLGLTGAVVAALNYFRRSAYSEVDIVPAMWLFAVAMWMVWGWRHLLKTTAAQPEFVMLAFGFGIWFEFDLAWKVVQLAAHKNTLPHAARHLAYSFGALAVSLMLFRLVAMRRQG